MRCPECDFENPDGFSFCGHCGARLAAAPAEERKLVTVLFADVVEFTALSERRDPEAVRQAMNLYFSALTREVERLEGTVEKYVGDAVLAVFGAPHAHENDPERAIRVALAMKDALARLQPDLTKLMGQGFQIRVGIHTGEVVAGEVYARGQRDYIVTGDSVNLAARLQTAAPPGGILVSESTYRRARAAFEFGPPHAISVKGKRQMVTVRQVFGPRARRGPERGIAGLHAPMIGRDSELAMMKATYKRAVTDYYPQTLFITGEAGIGKSRLVSEFLNWLAEVHPQAQVLQGRALSHGQPVPYLILADLFRGYFDLRGTENSVQAQSHLEETLHALLPADLASTEFDYQFHSLSAILGLRDHGDSLLALPPAQRLERIFLSLLRLLEVIGKAQPTVLIFEDLHWADGLSLAFIRNLVAFHAAVPIFTVLISRPVHEGSENMAALQHRVGELGYPILSMQVLTEEESQSLAIKLLPAAPSAVPLLALAVVKSDGNPFFIEEMIRAYIEEQSVVKNGERWKATRSLSDIRVPETIQGMLGARIDRLSASHKATLQKAAIIGRNFWQCLLADLVGCSVDEDLAILEEREMVHLLPASRFEEDAEYTFNHTLLQEVAYHSVLKSNRLQAHRQIGEWLEKRFTDRLEEAYDLLAHHYRLSDDLPRALEYLQKAGQRAQADYANREAVVYYDQALDVLDRLDAAGQAYPESHFDILCGRSEVYDVLGQREAQEADIAALVDLAQELNDDRRLARAYNQRSWYYWAVGDYDHAESSARAALEIAEGAGDVQGQGQARWNLGSVLRWQGRPQQALSHFQTAHELFEMCDSVAMAGRSLDRLASAYYDLGEYQTALVSAEQALALHRQTGRRRNEAQVLIRMGMIYADVLGNYSLALECYHAALDIQQEIGDRWLLGTLDNDIGELLIRLGRFEEAESHLRQGHDIWRETRDAEGLFDNLSARAALYLALGDADAAIVCLQEAVGLAPGPAQMADGIGRLAIAHLCRGQSGDVAHALTLIEEIQAIGEERQLRRGESLLWQAEIHLAADRSQAAFVLCQEAAQALGESSYRREALHWLTAQALQALERDSEGRAALHRAFAEVQRKAALITDEGLRASFLEQVSLNRQIIKAYKD
ncbi:MAG: adenylate/guanylate cyclase domain-containing protein [Chloroflexota bacterium]|nr:adenylate/guanylate cyclase domain-containing protein [Chloroflexota bacterium]